MPSVSVIILQYICPGFGAFLSNLMCLSPVRDVYMATKIGELGDINPTPWVFMFGQSFGWVTYGVVHKNLWLFSSDCLGLIASVWLNLSAIKLIYFKERRSISNKGTTPENDEPFSSEGVHNCDNEDNKNDDDFNITQRTIPIYDDKIESAHPDQKDSTGLATRRDLHTFWFSCHENKFIVTATLWLICISIINLGPSRFIDQNARETTVAIMASLYLVLYYCAPLSTIFAILKKRDSSPIYIPTTFANTTNASFWAAYGFAINDLSIVIPNGIGVLFGMIQIIVCACIPRRSNSMCAMQMEIQEQIQDDETADVPSKSNITFPVEL